jgi:hypothetical protein
VDQKRRQSSQSAFQSAKILFKKYPLSVSAAFASYGPPFE